MKQLFSLLTIFISLNTFAQTDYFKAKIFLANGETTEGYAKLPHNAGFDNSVSFKETPETKSSTIKNDDIKSILYYTEQGNQYLFERLPVRTINKSFGKYYDKTEKKKTWMLLNFSDPLINFYYASSRYIIDESGNITMQSSDRSGTWAEILLLLKRPDEDSAAQMTTMTSIKVGGLQSIFRKTASYYFQDQPEFAKRIEANEFAHDDIIRLAKYYIRYKSRSATQE